MKFKVGDKVRCVENTTTKRDFGGGGYKLGLEFNITKILRGSTGIYYGGFDGMGVFEEYLELVAFSEKIDFTQKGTKLPIISKRTQYRCSKWNDSLKNSESITPYSDLISFGTQYHNEIEYILAEFPGFTGRNYFMYPISEIERLAKEQNMIKETVKTKELPKSFGIKQDQSNRLWKEYMAWLNEKYDERSHGKSYNYYGISKSGEFDFWNDPKHFDQIITLEEWNEIVNGKQETRKELPKSFAIFRDGTNPLWNRYISYLNEKYGHEMKGDIQYYYGTTKSGNVNLYPNSDHFDQIITLEEWDEIVNSKQETVKIKELPKSFCIERDENNPSWKKYITWLNKKYNNNVSGNAYEYYGISHSNKIDYNTTPDFFETIITLEEWDSIALKEWDEIVNGKQEKQNKMEITREQLKNIHDIACSTWKKKIETEYATRNPWGDTIEFTQKEIVEMFKAADSKQTKVLEEVFGKQQEELDFRSDDINLKVDGLPVFGRSCDSSRESFIGLPIEECTKNVFYLNKNYEWVLKGNRLTVTRK